MQSQDKIKIVYDTIADKTLSFWCIIVYRINKYSTFTCKVHSVNHDQTKLVIDHVWYRWYIWKVIKISEVEKIIWHPINPWHVADWIMKSPLILDQFAVTPIKNHTRKSTQLNPLQKQTLFQTVVAIWPELKEPLPINTTEPREALTELLYIFATNKWPQPEIKD